MEKIAKRAVWFSAVEANDGEHILLLTDCPKLGLKYDLQSMPADVDNFSFNLPGRSVVVPLEEVSAALLAQSAIEAKESLDEEMEIKMKTVQVGYHSGGWQPRRLAQTCPRVGMLCKTCMANVGRRTRTGIMRGIW